MDVAFSHKVLIFVDWFSGDQWKPMRGEQLQFWTAEIKGPYIYYAHI